MDKKSFKKTTTKIYEEYGFVKKGKYYYLDLDDVVICSGFSHHHNITYLAYNFSIKAIHSEEERKTNDMFDGYDSMEIQMYFNRKASGSEKKEICFEQYTEDEYCNKLKEVLHYYFDPYKEEALVYIKRCCTEIGLVNKGYVIAIKESANEYLNAVLLP